MNVDKNNKILLVVAALIGIGVALWLWSRRKPSFTDPSSLDYIAITRYEPGVMVEYTFYDQISKSRNTIGVFPSNEAMDYTFNITLSGKISNNQKIEGLRLWSLLGVY